MKKTFLIILLSGIFTSLSFAQYSAVMADHSYRYVATPGFVNVTELNGALADRAPTNIVAYARPIFERRIGNWLQDRRTEQQQDGEQRRMAKELYERLKQKQESS